VRLSAGGLGLDLGLNSRNFNGQSTRITLLTRAPLCIIEDYIKNLILPRIEDAYLGEKRFEKENCCLAVIDASFGKYHDGGF